jgi:hypothetical protein
MQKHQEYSIFASEKQGHSTMEDNFNLEGNVLDQSPF